jgi:hypothetical protein
VPETRQALVVLEPNHFEIREATAHGSSLSDYQQTRAAFNDPTGGAIKIIVAP